MTTAPDALAFALDIQRTREPRQWPAALACVPAECRAECEEYLRGIADRLRTVRSARLSGDPRARHGVKVRG